LVESNRAFSAEEIAEELKISLAICKKALTELIKMKLIKEKGGNFESLD